MFWFLYLKAVIIIVYILGMVTTMARNLPRFDNEIVRHIIGYFPVMPYIQVWPQLSNKSERLSLSLLALLI